MNEEKIRRRTIRLSPFVDEELNEIAKKNKMSVNKLIGELVVYHINELDKINNVSNVAVILNNLDNLQKENRYTYRLAKYISKTDICE